MKYVTHLAFQKSTLRFVWDFQQTGKEAETLGNNAGVPDDIPASKGFGYCALSSARLPTVDSLTHQHFVKAKHHQSPPNVTILT